MNTRIVKFEAENVKKLKAVQITPDGNVIVIGGKNGAGKSSVLDAILYAIGGKENICGTPLRQGEKKGKIRVELEDLTIVRTFTEEGGGSLTVMNKEGAKFGSPQAMLDKLIGRFTFDPLAFTRLDPGKQLELLKGLVGLDFTEINDARKRAYDERTAINREVASLEGQIAGIPEDRDAPAEEMSIPDLMTDLESADEKNRSRAEVKATVDRERARLTQLDAELKRANQQYLDKNNQVEKAKQEAKAAADAAGSIEKVDLGPLKKKIEELTKQLQAAEEINRIYSERSDAADRARKAEQTAIEEAKLAGGIVNELQREREKLVDAGNAAVEMLKNAAEIDTAPLRQRVADAEQINARVRRNAQRAALAEKLKEKLAAAEELSTAISAADDGKTAALAAAKFPVAGLSFGEDGVLLNDLPFGQASSAEQLRVSVAMGIAMNPQLRVMMIRDGSLLDDNSLAMIAGLAKTNDYQVWIERVSDGAEVSVIIEDGEVKK